MPGPTVVYLQLFLKNDTYLGVGRGMGGGEGVGDGHTWKGKKGKGVYEPKAQVAQMAGA